MSHSLFKNHQMEKADQVLEVSSFVIHLANCSFDGWS